MTSDIMITSGFNFEGYEITDYLGFCSAESVFSTYFFRSLFGSSIASASLAVDGGLYKSELQSAKDAAMKELCSKALSLGANAIIGIDLDYTTFSPDVMGVIANGSAVKIQPKEGYAEESIPVKVINYNPDLDFRPITLLITICKENFTFRLKIAGKSLEAIKGVNADITFIDIFDEEYNYYNIGFINFCSSPNSLDALSSQTNCKIPAELLPLIKSARVNIKKYITDGKINEATCNDCLWISQKTDDPEEPEQEPPKVVSQGLNVKEYIKNITFLSSATEIYNYTKDLNDANKSFLNPDFLQMIFISATLERSYGNLKKECIKKIEKYFAAELL